MRGSLFLYTSKPWDRRAFTYLLQVMARPKFASESERQYTRSQSHHSGYPTSKSNSEREKYWNACKLLKTRKQSEKGTKEQTPRTDSFVQKKIKCYRSKSQQDYSTAEIYSNQREQEHSLLIIEVNNGLKKAVPSNRNTTFYLSSKVIRCWACCSFRKKKRGGGTQSVAITIGGKDRSCCFQRLKCGSADS